MSSKQKKLAVIVSVLAVLFIIMAIWIAYDNTILEFNSCTVECARLPESFDGYRIALVSDLHNDEFGENNEALLSGLRRESPDMIAITGDMIDSRRTDTELALSFAAEAVKIAPCYYVSGNHESRIEEYAEFRNALSALGVIVLENELTEITRGDEKLTILGVIDTAFINKDEDANFEADTAVMSEQLDRVLDGVDGYTLLLSHRPGFFETYAENDLDLILSGHAHGGQFRLPIIGGLVGGEHLLFPKYDAGLYTKGNTNMVVSRGLGNSAFPFRVNNRSEVVMIELKSKK